MLRLLSPFLLGLIISFAALSQRIDETFQPKLLNHGYVYDATPLPDGRAIITGDLEYVNGVRVGGIARMNADGELDATFKTGMGVEGEDYVQSVARYADGKLLVYGYFSKFNGKKTNGIVRLNADGTFDNTFTSSLAPVTFVFSAGIQSTGKIILVGATRDADTYTYFITRLNADGTKDNGFQGTIANGRIWRIKILPDDKILAGGYFNMFGAATVRANLARLNANGTLDETFNTNISPDANNSVAEIQVLPDGKIFIGRTVNVTKLNSDGSPDDSFAPASPIESMNNMTVLNDGSLVVSNNSKLMKFSPTGALVTEITANTDYARTVFNLGNDRLLTGFYDPGVFASHKVRNANLEFDNTWTPSFILQTTTEDNVIDGFTVRKQGDKWLVRCDADYFTSGDVTDVHVVDGIFRLNADFTFDDSFQFTSGQYKDARVLYVDGNGKIYIQHTFDTIVRNIRRLNADGTPDDTFAAITCYLINDMDETADGNLIAVEWDYTINKGKLKKFNTSGVVDNSLDVTSAGQMRTIDVAGDGKWYIEIYYWDFTAALSVNGIPVNRIFRLNTNGTVDNSFNFQSVLTDIFRVDVQGNKVIAAGSIKKTQSSNFTVAIEQWSATGAPELQQADNIKNNRGEDFLVKGDYIYLITWDGDKFQVKRIKLTGEADKLFAPVTYHRSPLYTSIPGRIYSFSENSILVIGNGAHKIDIVGPANAPSQLNVSMTTSSNIEATLTWTDNGEDEAVFELERAEGSGTFSLLKTLDANTTTYKDNTVAEGKSYRYRIRGVNVGGASDYSNVAETGLITGIDEAAIGFNFYPNPVNDFVHIRSGDVVHAFTLRQIDGRLLENGSPGSNEFKINMTNYSSGLYLLQLDGTNNRKTIKIFKQ